MVSAFIEFALRNRGMVLLLTLGIVLSGMFCATQLPLDAVPDLTNVQVQIITEAPGLSPLEVESLLSFPVEGVMGGLPNVEQVRSISKFGISVVTIVFKEGTDLLRARQVVSERLPIAAATIPAGYGVPTMGPMATALGEIFQFQVKGSGYSAMELRTILNWNIAYQLRTVPGVTEINSHGGELQTFEIELNPDKLTNYGLNIEDLQKAVLNNNRNVGGGYLVKDGEARYIRGESQARTSEDLASIVIATHNNIPIRVQDVATVKLAPMIRAGLVTRDGEGEIVTGLVMMLIGENSRNVVHRVKAEIERIKPSLPPGVTIETLYDRTSLVEQALSTVEKNLVEGGIFVIVVLLLLLGNFAGAVIVALTIPLSMLFAVNLMYGFGITASLMSLGAIDFGLIVDSSVIMVENCVRRLAHEGGTRSKIAIIRDAALEVRKPTLFGVLIITIVYLPILTLQGTEGKLFRPMAFTVIFALMGSMIFSLSLMPVLCSYALSDKSEEKDVFLIRMIKSVYVPFVDFAIRRPVLMAVTSVAIFALSIPVGIRLGAEFMPRLNEGDLLIEMVRVPSASLEGAVKMGTEVEKTLLTVPEVHTVYCKTGRPEIANDVMGVHQTDIWTLLRPMEEWRPGLTRDELIAEMEEKLAHIPGAVFGFSQPIEMRVNELVAGVKSDVAALLYGPDLNVLRAKAEEIANVLQAIPGSEDLKTPSTGSLPMLRVSVKRDQLARYGVSASMVLDSVSALGGTNAGMLLEGQARHPIQIRLSEDWRNNVAAIRNIRVITPTGQAVPLSDLANIRMEEGPSEVERENIQRRSVVGVNVRGRDMAGFVAEAEEAIQAKVNLPPGYILRWGGQFEHLQTATRRLMLVVPIALALIMILLYTSLNSWKMTILISLALPMATTGGVAALALRELPFSISAGIGFIALFGVAVLDGLVWTNAAEQLRASGATAQAAAREASLVRLRPILMTAMTGALGFLPMAVATSPGAEIQRPLATVVIGGLVTSTLLTTLVLPAVYPWFAGRTPPRSDADAPDDTFGSHPAVPGHGHASGPGPDGHALHHA